VQNEGNGSAGQTDTYVLKGGGPETYEPKYGWKGYRYVEVTTEPGHRGWHGATAAGHRVGNRHGGAHRTGHVG